MSATEPPPPLNPALGDKLPQDLIAKLGDQEKTHYTVQYNASLKTMAAYHQEPTAQNLKNWTAAREALAELSVALIDRYQAQTTSEPEKTAAPDVFETQREVLAYLKGQGYKIEKSALSNHVRSRLLTKGKDGYKKKSVDRFAELALKNADTGQRASEAKTADLIERKLRAEIKKLEEHGIIASIERQTKQGKLISVEEVEEGLVGRAMVLEAGYEHMVYTRAAEWVELVGGDQSRTDQLITSLLEAKGEWLNQYAQASEFEITMG